MTHLHRAALAALLLSALPAGADAQPGTTPIQVGQRVTGTLGARDLKAFGRGPFRAYRLAATRGQKLLVTLESPDFDAYLFVSRIVGPLVEEIRSDDDGGEGNNARLRVTIPESGTYLVVAQAYDAGGTGAYTLRVQPAPAPTTGRWRPIAFGQTVTGELAETDNVDDEADRFFDVWTFTGRTGQRVTIRMESEDFDAYLVLGRMRNDEFVTIATDDDGGEDTNARLSTVLAEDGQYLIRATSYSEATGAYTLRADERGARAPAPPRPIRAGQRMRSELDDDDPVLEADGSFYELWSYRGRAGERLAIRMDSEAFDTYVTFGRMQNDEFEEIARMDDGGQGTNTLLELTLREDAEYLIRANSLRAERTGPYTLLVESSRDR